MNWVIFKLDKHLMISAIGPFKSIKEYSNYIDEHKLTSGEYLIVLLEKPKSNA